MLPSTQLRRPMVQMTRTMPIRLAMALSLVVPLWLPGAAVAQIAPRSKPSAAQAPVTPVIAAAPVPTPPPTPAQRPAQRAEVTYSGGQLAIKADNSSLNQILREISRETGIKITGGVADERVFGKYGPSSASEVLTALLDGTGSNMLFLHSDASTPGELILTPQQGGPTPPNLNAKGFDDDSDEDLPPTPLNILNRAQQSEDQPQTSPANKPSQPEPTPPEANQPTAAPAATPAPPSTDNSAPASNDPADPNGTKTPQQIFQQLQQLRQQQQQPK